MSRSTSAQIEILRERLYEAVHGRWSNALAAVADMIGADSALTFQPTFQHGKGFGAGWIALNLPDPDIANDHADASGEVDVWTEASIRKGLYKAGAVLRGQDIVDAAEWDRHSWRDAVLRPFDIRHWAGCLGSAPDPTQANITYSFFRGPRRRPFGRRELRTLQQIYPDLDRAGRLAYRLGRPQTHALTERALDALLDPVLMVDPTGRLLFANAAADASLGLHSFPLSIEAGRIVAVREKEALRAALAAAGRGRGSDLALSDRRGARHDVIVTTLRQTSPVAAILTVRATAEAPGRRERLMARYGLTPAEADIALLLTEGLSAVEIAARRTVSVRTVQTQCESILRKLDVRRQTDIVRVVASTLWACER